MRIKRITMRRDSFVGDGLFPLAKNNLNLGLRAVANEFYRRFLTHVLVAKVIGQVSRFANVLAVDSYDQVAGLETRFLVTC